MKNSIFIDIFKIIDYSIYFQNEKNAQNKRKVFVL